MDWEKEELLEGLEGDDREAREDLLDQLHGADVDVEELRKAVDEDRLALLPVEIELGGERSLTQEEVAEKADVPVDFLLEQRRALGLPQMPKDEKAFGKEDVEAAKQLKDFIDAGLDKDGVVEVTRVLGESMDRVARAVAELTATSLLRDAENEREIGLRFAQAARELGPILGSQLEYVFKNQLREIVRNDVVSRAQITSGELPGAELVNVSFADLVGFTKLGEDLPPGEVGRVAGRLSQLAAEIAEPPVRLVKTIGDAAMLVSPETEPLINATIALVRGGRRGGRGLPAAAWRHRARRRDRPRRRLVRPAGERSRRVTGVARPGSVLATEEVKDEAEDEFQWSFAGRRKLKNVTGQLPLFRARRLEEGADS